MPTYQDTLPYNKLLFQYKEAEAELLGAPPTYQDTLPFQLYRLAKYCVLGAPALPGLSWTLGVGPLNKWAFLISLRNSDIVRLFVLFFVLSSFFTCFFFSSSDQCMKLFLARITFFCLKLSTGVIYRIF